MTPESLIPIGTLLAAIAGLFGLLVASQNKRAEEALDRAKAAEQQALQARTNESLARDREVTAWRDAAHLLGGSNEKLAAITTALIDQRRLPPNRS